MNKKFSIILVFLFLSNAFVLPALAQGLDVEISVPPDDPENISVKGSFTGERTEQALLFLLSYADAENLATRVGDVKLFDASGAVIAHRKIADGTYSADRPFTAFDYRVRAAFPRNVTSSAHISWISERKGILRLNDLLPAFETRYKLDVSIKLPLDWNISTAENSIGANRFAIDDFEPAVFAVGREWSAQKFKISGVTVSFAIDDRWQLDRSEAEKATAAILGAYENRFGPTPENDLNLIYFKMPDVSGFDRWRAETRGPNIIVMSSPPAFESHLRQRFREQLRHELLHLWIPNDLALDGDYAWFYEGFAQYAALRTGVELNQITFGDFLNTLEQANNFGNRRSQPISLLEASKNRWFVENSSVYAKGLAVAFLLDAALIRSSRGKHDLFTVMREIYLKHKRPNSSREANAAIIGVLEKYDGLSPIIEDYVRGSEKLDFQKHLTETGLKIAREAAFIKLEVESDLSRREKDFLNKLGYNNWRKFLSK